MKIVESVSIFGHLTHEVTQRTSEVLKPNKIVVNDKFTRFDGCSYPVKHPKECTVIVNELTGIDKKYIYLAYTDVE